MRFLPCCLLLAFVLGLVSRGASTVLQEQPADASTPGAIVAVGGGGTPDAVLHWMLAAARGGESHVVVLPQASQRDDRGVDTAQMWRDAGAHGVTVLDTRDGTAPDAARAFATADIVWMSGGAQSRLVEHVESEGWLELLREAWRRGALVGGTSAGAAVLGERMISGSPEPASFVAGATGRLTGLGLLPDVIVDQHFVERSRQGRLLTAVLDEPERVGVGISERTAAIFEGGAMTTLGEGPVLVYDARDAEVLATERDDPQAARGVTLHVLPPGDRIEL